MSLKVPPGVLVFGDPKEAVGGTEIYHQQSYFNKLRREKPLLGKIAVHIRNEQKRVKGQLSRVVEDKLSGMVSGASDILIPGPQTLVMETKVKGGRWRPGQEEYLKSCAEAGAMACLCWGAMGLWLATEYWQKKNCISD